MAERDRVHWNQRYREAGEEELAAPSRSLLALETWLPIQGRALDLAGGRGRHAFWLARRGLDVTLVDLSPVAVDWVAAQAARSSLNVQAVTWDLDVEPVPEGPWSMVLINWYLNRSCLRELAVVLQPGGILLVAHPTRRNLERHPRPGAHHLLLTGELPRLVPGLEIVYFDEGWNEAGFHEARLIARRRPTDSSPEFRSLPPAQ